MKTNDLIPLQWGKRALIAFSLLLVLYACNSHQEKTTEGGNIDNIQTTPTTKRNQKGKSAAAAKDQADAETNTIALEEDVSPPKIKEKKPANENTFLSVKTAPLSTFSIDVDNASYSRARKSINNGQLPSTSSVRLEEFINYFNYQYKQPEGQHPFSVNTEVAKCPWNPKNHLVHIGLQGKRLDSRKLKLSNLVFLIDVSGSMSAPDKLPLLRKAFKMLVNNLGEEDRVAIVVYAGNAGLVLPATQGTDKQKIMEALDKLQSGGSTAGGAGIKLAYKIAKQNFIKEGNNRIILATDGDFNLGASSDQAMQNLIEEKRKEGVFITVLGLGMGNYRDSKMEIIADKGNGNYYYLDNLNEAYKVFGKDLKGTLFTIAKDVKIQVEFNSAVVKSYRLIGYENRLLANRDFRDDTKDAGEIGAGHTVTALYEVTLHSNPQTVAVDQNQIPANFQATQFNNQQLMNVRLRYKKPEGSTGIETSQIIAANHQSVDETSHNFRFSAAVASFGMLLKNSQYKGSTTFQTVLTLAKGSKGKDMNQYRAEFIDLVQKASQITTQ
ncbi:vWA domain-containing protein [Microscilla marina]|uniref:von Willebrand factor type A domain protein n=1 Tax=Microscilla marina ATCC 23134 TaxID=313606 RepID=A1ZU67_MICM2|nr:VWA domain-containing protein [Microscilla marina]EAY26038.1 von Willebrand factor type A domain protein [Microscilla marina ATCC 23134]